MNRVNLLSTFLAFLLTCVNVIAQENFELPMPPEPMPASVPSDIIQKPRNKTATQKQQVSTDIPTVKSPVSDHLTEPEPPIQNKVFRHPQRKRPAVSKRAEKAIPRHIDTEPILPPALPIPPKAARNIPN